MNEQTTTPEMATDKQLGYLSDLIAEAREWTLTDSNISLVRLNLNQNDLIRTLRIITRDEWNANSDELRAAWRAGLTAWVEAGCPLPKDALTKHNASLFIDIIKARGGYGLGALWAWLNREMLRGMVGR